MKKNYLLFLVAALAMLKVSAQTITSFTVVPPNPTSADTVTIYVECNFQNSGCAGMTFLNGITGNEISAGGLHCMGSITTTCIDYDTVVVPPMAAGQYSFVFLLSTGVTTGCIPGIVPLVIDSTHFTVSPVTGVYDSGDNNRAIEIMPNPSNGKFIVKQNAGENTLLKIFSAEGRLVESFALINKETEINCFLPPGIYIVMTECKDKRLFSKLVLVK